MKTLTIKDIPNDGVVEKIKEMASVAIERYYREATKPTEQVITEFETKVDDFRVANGLNKKFEIEEEEKI